MNGQALHKHLPLNNRGYYPSHVLETKRQISYNTMENRFVRWMLLRISSKLKDIKARLMKKGHLQDPLLAKRLEFMQTQIKRLLNLDFLKVGEMKQLSISLVLQMAPGYREVYRNYLQSQASHPTPTDGDV